MNSYLDQFIPACAYNNWILRIRAESHTRHPLSMAFIRNRKFAIPEGIPELDRSIARTRDDLAVIRGEGD
jgi:hypothetical protein